MDTPHGHPVDGPIEYFFNTLEQQLSITMHEIHNQADIYNKVYQIINSVDTFAPYFHGVGFQ
jgi:hypothetical protein